MAKRQQKSGIAEKQRKRKHPSMLPWIRRLSRLRRRNRLPLVLRGRRFSYRGLRVVMRSVADHYSEGRTRISEVICIQLNWRQPNGWLKDRACRDVLRQLEKLHLIKLPPRLSNPQNVKSTANDARRKELLRNIETPLAAMPEKIELEFAKGNAAEHLWNAVIEKHHYLGHRVQVGRCLKYLIRGDGQLIGAISFSSPAWKLGARDNLMKQIGMSPSKVRDFVINNSRFCILPKVRVPHLASRILAQAARQAAVDWFQFYSIKPLFAETFVEPTRFEGTCYRAANWNEIGTTSGYAKLGSTHHNSQEPKLVFLYGLTRSNRRRLATLIPCPKPQGAGN